MSNKIICYSPTDYRTIHGHGRYLFLHEMMRNLLSIALATKRNLFYCSNCDTLEISQEELMKCPACGKETGLRAVKDDEARLVVTSSLISKDKRRYENE